MGNTKRAKPLTVPELERAKALSALGHSYRAIAVELNRSDKTIKRALTRTPEVIQEVKKIKLELSDLFENLAERMVTSITDADIQKLDAYKRTLSGAVAVDKMRLLRDQSTGNLNIKELALIEIDLKRLGESLRVLEDEKG